MARKISPVEDRFWGRVDITEDSNDCWEYTGFRDMAGYGKFALDTKTTVQAHRLAFFLHYGWWPNICRHYVCDNSSCCNPYHLRDGTPQDNMRDMVEQGRCKPAFGAEHYNIKLSEDQVRYIRSSPKSANKLAKELGVSQPVVSDARRGTTHKYVK